MKHLAPFILAAFAATLLGCGTTPRTQIMVVVDTDLAIPTELDEIAFELTGPDGQMRDAQADLASLPAYLAVAHEDGPLSPLEVRVVGRLGGVDVVERLARVAFVPERTVTLVMHLAATCVAQSCAAGETCGESGCRPVDVDAGELADWTGTPPRLDGGAMDAGTDAPTDAPTDSGTDAPTDAPADSATDTGMMDTGMMDTGMPDTGTMCPACDLTRDPSNCGAIGNVCANDEYCISGSCQCRPELTLVGGSCVDLQTDPMNCGTMGNVCANNCRGGSCSASCGPTTECMNACVDTMSDAAHCGGCGVACTAGQVCANGACRDFVVRNDCTTCPCTTCPSGFNCCRYPIASDAICVDGPCP